MAVTTNPFHQQKTLENSGGMFVAILKPSRKEVAFGHLFDSSFGHCPEKPINRRSTRSIAQSPHVHCLIREISAIGVNIGFIPETVVCLSRNAHSKSPCNARQLAFYSSHQPEKPVFIAFSSITTIHSLSSPDQRHTHEQWNGEE